MIGRWRTKTKTSLRTKTITKSKSSLMSIERIFFELLQVAVGNRKSLSRVPTAREWGELYNMATRQALTGVCFVALQRLSNDNPSTNSGQANHTPSTINLPEALRLRWLGMAAKILQRNASALEVCKEVVQQFTHDGLQCCVLKGLSNRDNYDMDGGASGQSLKDMRTSGDIDMWCSPFEDVEIAVGDSAGAHYEHYRGMRGVIEYGLMQARIAGKEKPSINYYHTDLGGIWKTNVELHHRPTCLCSPLRNHRLKQWVAENEQFGVCTSLDGLPVPTNSFNAVYQLLHIFKHLLYEGIGLRQLMDYYCVLRALHVEQGEFNNRTSSMAQWAEGMGVAVKSNAEIMHVLGRLGIKRFASAVMYVLQKVFVMPDAYLLCAPDAKAGAFLLDEIMLAGNFGQHDDRVERGKHNAQNVWVKMKRNWKFLKYYPEEVMWEPLFRVYHHYWRAWELWRF